MVLCRRAVLPGEQDRPSVELLYEFVQVQGQTLGLPFA
jgi:hypothetical protein